MSEDSSLFNLDNQRKLLQLQELSADNQHLISQLIDQVEKLTAENGRLRKALLRANAANAPRMSSKLKDALYE